MHIENDMPTWEFIGREQKYLQERLFEKLSEMALEEFKKQLKPTLEELTKQLILREVEVYNSLPLMQKVADLRFTFNGERVL